MAKFVIAGKADCPNYAKAEFLADELNRSLPNFRVHKISIPPEEWKGWHEHKCKENGWKHEHCPLVWRELVEQGGKGMLLGGLDDFLQHCQVYYGITSEMSADMMLKIAAENLKTQMSLIAEKQDHLSHIQPLHIWITGALSLTSNILIPHLLSAEVFPKVTAIQLHLLDLDGNEEEMQELKMNTEDLVLSMLHQVTVHTDLQQTFQEANVILLLDDFSTARDNEGDEERKKSVSEISERYRKYGQLIDRHASKQVKAIVSGDSFVNLRCLLLVESTPSIDSRQFVAMATQLENEARAIIAKQLKVRLLDVTDVFVWGNISGDFFIDLQRAKVFNYCGAITGPPSHSQPVRNILYDRKWLETDFQRQVGFHRVAVTTKTGRAAAISATNGILRLLQAWYGTCSPDGILSVGVLCSGLYNLPDGIILSAPVTFRDGKWFQLPDVAVDEKLKEKLEICSNKLQQVCYKPHECVRT